MALFTKWLCGPTSEKRPRPPCVPFLPLLIVQPRLFWLRWPPHPCLRHIVQLPSRRHLPPPPPPPPPPHVRYRHLQDRRCLCRRPFLRAQSVRQLQSRCARRLPFLLRS